MDLDQMNSHDDAMKTAKTKQYPPRKKSAVRKFTHRRTHGMSSHKQYVAADKYRMLAIKVQVTQYIDYFDQKLNIINRHHREFSEDTKTTVTQIRKLLSKLRFNLKQVTWRSFVTLWSQGLDL